jgi:hypothetical protein
VIAHFLGIRLRHDLDGELPLRELAPFDGFVQVALMGFTALANGSFCFDVSQVLDAP